jgi:NADH:ubiquinone oxidoreductase subunit K
MGRFYTYLLLFMGSMLGIVLSENMILLMMFWELTSISSFLLIGFWSYRTDARQGRVMALVITGGGGFAMLAGFILLGHIVGSFELTTILAAKENLHAHHLYPSHPDPDPGRGLHQVGPVSLPVLAAPRHGRTDAGQCLSAFGDHGQGRGVSAGPAVPGAGGQLPVVLSWSPSPA